VIKALQHQYHFQALFHLHPVVPHQALHPLVHHAPALHHVVALALNQPAHHHHLHHAPPFFLV